ncbi:MAG: diaminopimelate epimerase [Ahniella sp.]|nr:diaminopimelate epimerase [Ahniella sp.]
MPIPFTKMHGIGNDFVILDRREHNTPLSATLATQLADRHFGVGCDQVITIERADSGASARYLIFNQDGSRAGQCGNGLRCVAAWLWRASPELGDTLELEGDAGRMVCERLPGGLIRAAIGTPQFEPAKVPFVASQESGQYLLGVEGRSIEIGVVSMGNPHALVVVPSIDSAPVAELGPRIERHSRFPDRVNVGFAELVDRGTIKLRVFERGVGETLACGSGASAAVAILRLRGLVDPRVTVLLTGGTLSIEWNGRGEPLSMTGPTRFVFDGTWNDD